MTRTEVRQAIIDIIAELVPDDDLSILDDTTSIRDQTGLDSMDFLDIIMELRKRYSIHVLEEDYPQFVTIEGCINYLHPLLIDR